MRRAVLGLLALVILFASLPAVGQVVAPLRGFGSITTAGSDCTTTTSCVITNARGTSNAGVQITGTFVATLQFEGTLDDATWFAVTMTPIGGTTTVTSATAGGQWTHTTPLSQFRVRASAYTSGTAVVTMIQTSARVSGGGATALVTLPVPLHRPHVNHNLLADAENLTYKSVTMTTIATDKWGWIFPSMPRLAGVASYPLDQMTIQFNGAPTPPTSGLSVSVQGIGTSGLQCDGVVNGSTVNVPAASILANTLVTVSGLGATISAPTGVCLEAIPANRGDASGVNITMTALQAATGRVAFMSTARVVKNNAALTDSMPMTFLATQTGATIPLLGNYPHRLNGITNASAAPEDRTDPFIVNVTVTCTAGGFCFTPGTTAAVDASAVLTSTAHGLTGVSPYMRARLFDGPYAGLTRVAVRSITADTAQLDEPFPAVIVAGTNWQRWLFATEYGMHCSGADTLFTQQVNGLWASLAATGTTSAFNIYLLDSTGQTPLAKNEGKLLGGMLSGLGTTGTPGEYYFDTPYSLSPNVAHYYTVAGAGANTIGIPVGKTVTAAQLAALYDGISSCVFTERLKQKGSGTVAVSLSSGTTARLTFSAALTLLNRVVFNTTTAAYNDWINIDAGTSNLNTRCRLKTEVVAQTTYDVDNCTATMVDDGTGRAFTVYGTWSDRTASIASMGLSIDKVRALLRDPKRYSRIEVGRHPRLRSGALYRIAA